MVTLTDLCSIFHGEWNTEGHRPPHEMQKQHWPVLFSEQLQANRYIVGQLRNSVTHYRHYKSHVMAFGIPIKTLLIPGVDLAGLHNLKVFKFTV